MSSHACAHVICFLQIKFFLTRWKCKNKELKNKGMYKFKSIVLSTSKGVRNNLYVSSTCTLYLYMVITCHHFFIKVKVKDTLNISHKVLFK